MRYGTQAMGIVFYPGSDRIGFYFSIFEYLFVFGELFLKIEMSRFYWEEELTINLGKDRKPKIKNENVIIKVRDPSSTMTSSIMVDSTENSDLLGKFQ